MNRSTHLFIVCSSRARVGKTLVARLCAEFFRADARAVGLYDLDPYERALTGFLPDLAASVAIAETRDQMELFDRLIEDDGKPKVIDVGILAFEPFFKIMHAIDFAGEARRRAINPMVLFLADPDPRSARTYALLQEKFPDFDYVPVHNDAIARGIEFRQTFASKTGLVPLHVPQLSSSLKFIVDRRPFSFADFLRSPPADMPQNLRLELETWLKRTFRQLREIELQLLMTSLKFSLAEPVAAALSPEAEPAAADGPTETAPAPGIGESAGEAVGETVRETVAQPATADQVGETLLSDAQ